MNATEDFAFETEGLGKRFGARHALRDVSLRVPRGGVHALVGRNGAGKSTLLRILLGFQRPSAGASRVLGNDSRDLSPAARGRIAYVNEEHALPGWMTVADIREAHRHTHPRWSEKVYAEVVGLFRVDAAHRASQLSHGERAGLALALALAQTPELLLLDEPTLGLDTVAKQALVEVLLFVCDREQTTVVYSSHHLDEIERVADDLIVLAEGALSAFATPDELSARVAAWLVDTLPEGGTRAIPGLLQAREIEGQTQILVLDPGDDFPATLSVLGARGLTRTPLGFDRALNAFLSRPRESRA